MHVHSDYSHDGKDSLERLREVALQRGIGFIGLTDHAEDFDAERFSKYTAHCAALSDDTVYLVPGLEFRFAGYTGLHLLALGLSRWIEPRTPAEFIEQTRGAVELTMVAHPILAQYQVPDPVLDGINAIEVWNAGYNTRYLPDPRAIRLLHRLRRRRPSVVGVAGLDQHDSRNDRETRVIVAGDGHPLAALKAGTFRNRGRTMSFDSAASIAPLRLYALYGARWTFDRVERTQERFARARAARSAAG
ncbi:MAG TPA: PHP domain-containing protein [Gemmatimonadaceae bacterium]|nr:PHP domain-containing protein [Gemmatimonadaceae bacterium]